MDSGFTVSQLLKAVGGYGGLSKHDSPAFENLRDYIDEDGNKATFTKSEMTKLFGFLKSYDHNNHYDNEVFTTRDANGQEWIAPPSNYLKNLSDDVKNMDTDALLASFTNVARAYGDKDVWEGNSWEINGLKTQEEAIEAVLVPLNYTNNSNGRSFSLRFRDYLTQWKAIYSPTDAMSKDEYKKAVSDLSKLQGGWDASDAPRGVKLTNLKRSANRLSNPESMHLLNEDTIDDHFAAIKDRRRTFGGIGEVITVEDIDVMASNTLGNPELAGGRRQYFPGVHPNYTGDDDRVGRHLKDENFHPYPASGEREGDLSEAEYNIMVNSLVRDIDGEVEANHSYGKYLHALWTPPRENPESPGNAPNCGQYCELDANDIANVVYGALLTRKCQTREQLQEKGITLDSVKQKINKVWNEHNKGDWAYGEGSHVYLGAISDEIFQWVEDSKPAQP